jgi:hypothetical protein
VSSAPQSPQQRLPGPFNDIDKYQVRVVSRQRPSRFVHAQQNRIAAPQYANFHTGDEASGSKFCAEFGVAIPDSYHECAIAVAQRGQGCYWWFGPAVHDLELAKSVIAM